MPLLKRLFAFSALFLLLSAQFASAADVNVVKLMQTGQLLPSSDPPETTDDGSLKMGLHWSASTRFVTNPDGTITDNMTGLMWMPYGDLTTRTKYHNADANGHVNWHNALDLINQINNGPLTQYNMGYTDWRLPNIIELESITTAGESCDAMLNSCGFYNVAPDNYASSTTFAGSLSNMLYELMICGKMVESDKRSSLKVLAVRGEANGEGAVWQTGQTASYDTGDDGALKKGVKWPDPRFVDLGDGTVADRLTNLIWLQDAGTPAYGTYKARNTKTWTDALDYIAQMNQGSYLGHTDWRLPNRRELESLVDFSQSAPALTPGNGFNHVMFGNNSSISKRSPYFYWSSTSHFSHHERAFFLDLYNGVNGGFTYKRPYTFSNSTTVHPAPRYFAWPVSGDTTVQLQIPASKVTSPHDGDYMPGPLGAYSITGKADEIGGTISGVSVSTDGGKTWDAATDTSGDGSWSTWQYSWTPFAPGSYTIQSKAADGNGKEEFPGPGIKVSAGIYTLTVNHTTNGTVTLSPSGGTYNDGTKVTVTANPAAGYAFTGWSGALSGATSPAVVTMDASKSIGASFALSQYSLTVSVSPTGGGTVTKNPASGPYSHGASVTLTATPATDYVFTGWSGGLSGTANPTVVTMDSDKSVTANFALRNMMAFSFTQNGQSVTINATYSGASPSGKAVKFMRSDDGGKTWSLITTAVTNNDGACSTTSIFSLGSHKVKAVCIANGQAYRSGVLDCNIARVMILSPTNGAVVNAPTPAISWSAIPGATGYAVRTVAGGTVLTPVSVDGNTTSAALPALPKGQNTAYNVRALLPTGNSVVSSVNRITYKDAAVVTVSPGLSGRTITPAATLTGKNSGPAAGETITFVLKNSAGVVIARGNAVTDNTGTAHLAPRTLSAGTFILRVVFAGTPGLTTSAASVGFQVQ